MFILSANGTVFIDTTGLGMEPIYGIDNNGQIVNDKIVGFQIIGFSFNYNMTLGKYPTEDMARKVFNDMVANISSGKETYDVHNANKRLFGKDTAEEIRWAW